MIHLIHSRITPPTISPDSSWPREHGFNTESDQHSDEVTYGKEPIRCQNYRELPSPTRSYAIESAKGPSLMHLSTVRIRLMISPQTTKAYLPPPNPPQQHQSRPRLTMEARSPSEHLRKVKSRRSREKALPIWWNPQYHGLSR